MKILKPEALTRQKDIGESKLSDSKGWFIQVKHNANNGSRFNEIEALESFSVRRMAMSPQ